MRDIGKNIDIGNATPIVSLDSEIERIFYDRCCNNKAYTNILIEWINNKPVYEKYTQMIVKAYGNYSKHDQSHSVAILESIYAIIGGNRINSMDIMDLWLLLHCAYAHDIGMPYTYDEAKEFWKSVKDNDSEFRKFLEECFDSSTDKDAKSAAEYIISISKKIGSELSDVAGRRGIFDINRKITEYWPLEMGRHCEYLMTEFCRKNHTKRSEMFMMKKADEITYNTPYVLSSRFYKIVAKCSMVHGENFESVIELDNEEWAKESKAHPAFVASLLRLGDLLDIDNNRFDSIVLEYYGRLPKISELHKMKHDSITHIDLTEDKIEIVAKSDDLEVCKCISDWFSYIDKEVTNLIFAWGKIAPKGMKGCKLTVPVLKNFYRNQRFADYESREFNVNKEMLINLVIGKNLYESDIDFIREYLQNSIDALKMKLWMDLEDELLDIELKPDVLKKIKNNRYLVTPFDFMPSVFFRYAIDIYCKLCEEDDAAYIEVSIGDRGIGIDEECLKAISNIGSGWKKREKYKRHLENMPFWLKPTGGFGIGMQSGFMVADEVAIITKCENEVAGRKITLHSTAKSGKVSEQGDSEMRHIGTTVIVKIPYEKFMDSCEYKGRMLINESYGDFFDTNKIIQGVSDIIYNYVNYVVGSSIFPISVCRVGFEPRKIPQKFQRDTELIDEVEIEEFHYKIYKETGTSVIYLWRIDDDVLCTIGTENEEEISWYYKGVRVFDNEASRVSYFLYGFSSISIDIMGIKVEDCLTVDRSKFLSKFNYEKMLCDFIIAYFNSNKIIDDLLKNEAVTFGKKPKDFFCMIFAFIYVKNIAVRNKLKNFYTEKVIMVKDFDVAGTTIKTINKVHTGETAENERLEDAKDNVESLGAEKSNTNKKTKNVKWGVTNLRQICYQLWSEKDIYIVKNTNILENMIEDYLTTKSISGIGEEILILSEELYNCFDHFYINDIKHIYNDTISKGNVQCELCIIKYSGKKDDDIIDDVADYNLLKPGIYSKEGYGIYWSNDKYMELQVKELPWKYKINEPIGTLGNEKRHMIISPIRPIYSDEELLKSMLNGKEDQFNELKKIIIENKAFTYLVNWVYSHQLEENRYSKDVIREKYEDFLHEWFEMYIEKSK
jgi:hypothetical protein